MQLSLILFGLLFISVLANAQPVSGEGCLAVSSSIGVTPNTVYQFRSGSRNGSPLFLASSAPQTPLDHPSYPCWTWTSSGGTCVIKNTGSGNAPKNFITGTYGTFSGGDGTFCVDFDNSIFILFGGVLLAASLQLRQQNRIKA